MIVLNTPQTLPSKGFWYGFTRLLLFLLSFSWLISLFAKSSLISVFFPLFILVIPIIIYLYFDYKAVNFLVSNDNLVINSGIIFKKSKEIPFCSIQTKNLSTGPLQGLFGVSTLSVWTSSQSQMQIHNGNSEQKADGSLLLETGDANQLREMMARK